MICNTSKELLAEIKKYMDINDISIKELSINMNKSQQSISQYFNNGNPKLESLFEICNALSVSIDFNLVSKNG
jgi:transcriptional regulator with XRE-family HTH domain